MIRLLFPIIIFFSLTIYSQAAPFQNGSFEQDATKWVANAGNSDTISTGEQDLTGWTIEAISGNAIDWWNNAQFPQVLSGAGTYSIELAGTSAQMRVYQIFDTIVGKTYSFRYYLYGRGTSQQNEIKITVKNSNSSGSTLVTQTVSPSTLNTWTEYNAVFTATSNTTYVAFENTIAAGVGSTIDKVELFMHPTFSSANKTYVYDPAYDKLKAIPGNDMVFMYSLENSGGVPDSGTVSMQFNIPTTLSFKVDSLTFIDGEVVGSIGYDPMFDGDSTGSSGLSCCSGGGEVQYSNGGGFGYIPSPSYYNDFGEGYDPNVRAIRIIPSGIMNDGSLSPTGFRVYYQAQIN